ncbi:hypothetical protein J1N35_033843 [Gossypium stocksii]|uniref:RNase H type-1 domain-containing protein n=1 Tax=Gossypium stocksii TaxID=47602 RepID=A0A9D3ZPP1_9ROSI|nr:hypothetical protein J1N35_033843 [Gossypium stocksii]
MSEVLSWLNLQLRHLAVNTVCLVCQAEEESVEHLFRDYSFRQQVLGGWEFQISHAIGIQIGGNGDALSIIHKLNSEEEDRSGVSSLIQDIKRQRISFRSLRFQYIPREANFATNEMAKEGCQYEVPRYWIEEVPQAVEGIVILERRIVSDGR